MSQIIGSVYVTYICFDDRDALFSKTWFLEIHLKEARRFSQVIDYELQSLLYL